MNLQPEVKKMKEGKKPYLKIFTSKIEAILILVILLIGGIFALIRFL